MGLLGNIYKKHFFFLAAWFGDVIAGTLVAILDPEDKDHTSGEADQRSGRSLGLSDLVDLSYQLYLIRCCD